jgi:isoleucyl-tRNA synthetase
VREHIACSASLIEEELNVKQVGVEADEGAFTSVKVKPNFKTLGKRCGPKLKEISAALAGWGYAEVNQLEEGQSLEVAGEALGIGDVILQRQAAPNTAVATDGEITVVLDTSIDPALKREGLAREFISLIQNARKAAGLEVTDRIRLSYFSADAELMHALEEHAATIRKEVLASELRVDQTASTEATVNGVALRYSLEKA